MTNHPQDLVRCTNEALKALGREHDRVIEAQLKHHREDEARKKHAENMAVVVRRLWVRRTGGSNFMPLEDLSRYLIYVIAELIS